MKQTLLCALLLGSSVLFAQNGSVEQLKKGQATSRKYLSSEKSDRPTSKSLFVNPFVGTGGHGHTFPGATAPFGFMQLSPDTRYEGWDGCGGYHYSDDYIYGFSHTHLSGTGVPDYADLLVVPQSGKLNTVPGYKDKKGFGAHFTHEAESAAPGFYSVKLQEPEIDVRLTADVHSGLHEYTFHRKKDRKFIVLDFDYRDQLLSYDMQVVDNQHLKGSRISAYWAREQHFYFYLEANIPWKKSEIIDQDGKHQIVLEFPKDTEVLLLKVGISAVDEDGAKQNLYEEIPDFDFKRVRAKTTAAWDKELNRIDFETADQEVMHNFYTALYHTMIAPNTFNDVDGRYRGRDNQVHRLETDEGGNYTVFSLWDTYRAAHPLYTLIQQKRTNEFIRTFQRQFDQGGDLPVWELAGNETECMIGFHSVSVIADAYTKGIRDYDTDRILAAMVTTSELDEFGKKAFNEEQYLSMDRTPESVSKALEYAYDNYCIAEMYELSGLDDENAYRNYQKFLNRSLFFVNHFDPQTKFMRARKSGLWYSPFKPDEVNFNYTEANSWQYSLYTPQAIGELTQLLGGRDSLAAWLNRLYTADTKFSGREQVDITGLIGQYAHGNEPSHHIAYLYNYTNTPSRAQFYLDRIMRTLYHNAPDGLSGNEDCGQMSAWYVMSALGLYQICPGVPTYEIGRPMMDQATLNLENGKRFTIEARNNSVDNKYIQKIILNGKELPATNISHQQIMEGGVLVIQMGNRPNDELRNRTTRLKVPKTFTPVPYFTNESSTFKGSVNVNIGYPHVGESLYKIRYTVDGSVPTATSPEFTNSLTFDTTTVLTASLQNMSTRKMGVPVTATFLEMDDNVQLELESKYQNQYSAGGNDALIDGIRGGTDYRTGEWQGYSGEDVVANITFAQARIVDSIDASFLQDIRSWIFIPEQVRVRIEFSDGTSKSLPVQDFVTEVNDNSVRRVEFRFATGSSQPITRVRVVAENVEKTPSWHPYPGNTTWIFADEIRLVYPQ